MGLLDRIDEIEDQLYSLIKEDKLEEAAQLVFENIDEALALTKEFIPDKAEFPLRLKFGANWPCGSGVYHGDEDVQGRLDCPDFFRLNDKYVLFYLRNGLEYMIGEFKNEQFYPETKGTLTWNCGVGYAPESLIDIKG